MADDRKIVAWAAIAGGAEHNAGKYRMTVAGSARSARLAKELARNEFEKAWPGVTMGVLEVTAIREGD